MRGGKMLIATAAMMALGVRTSRFGGFGSSVKSKPKMPLISSEENYLKLLHGAAKRRYVLYLKTKYDFPRSRDVHEV